MPRSLTILGGGGWLPAFERQTACALLRDGASAILIDAGTGLSRLVERPELLDGVERLDIVLTHFHLDHVSGLAYLPAIGFCEETTIWGPGKLLYGASTAAALGRLSHEPFHPVPLEEQRIAVFDLPDAELEIGDFRLEVRRQDRHSSPSLGLRFENLLTWVTDTAYDPDSARFAAGSTLLAHEAWYAASAPRNAEIHSAAAQAAQVALDATVAELLLIHLPPFTADVDHLLAEARELFGNVTLARDGADVSALLGGVPVRQPAQHRSPAASR